ncbi:MAG: gamma-glutamyl-gamma-aminobutyrate hydrolase family protein [Candidatus Saccharimonadales bacterium]
MKKILIIDNKTDDIKSIYTACKHFGYEYKTVSAQQVRSINLEIFDIILLTGGIWYDDPAQQAQHYADELNLITKTKQPVLGICLGMQLIATAFGGQATRIRREHHGRREVRLTDYGKKLLGLGDEKMLVFENHSIGIIDLPDNFDTLAKSNECIEMIKHKSLPIVGVQFHPEKFNKQQHADDMWKSILWLIEK